MDKRVQISIMLDYYGALLTDKQSDVMDLYFNQDLSLAEISEITNTSRQAIHDIIKRCEKVLLEYELKLQLVKKSIEFTKAKEEVNRKLELLTDENVDLMEIHNMITEVKNYINDKF